MNLYRRISLFAVLVAGTMVIVFSGVAYKISNDNIIESAQRTVLKDTALMAVRVEAQLSHIAETLTNLSSNAVLFNALVDSAGRETYLLPFLQGFTQLDGIPINISLRDFQGKTVAEILPSLKTETEKKWLRKVIETGRSSATIMTVNGTQTMLAARMLTYPRTQTVEGVLLFSLPFRALMSPKLVSEFQRYKIRLHLAAADTEREAGRVLEQGNEFVVHRSLSMPKPLANIHLMAELRHDTSPMYTAQSGQILIYSVFGLLLIAVVILASLWFSRRLIRPLTELEKVAASIIESGNFDTRLSVSGSDEINRLRGTFNGLLDYLASAYANLDSTASGLRGVVQAIPDRMIVLDADGRRLTDTPLANLIRSSREGSDDEDPDDIPLPPRDEIARQIRKSTAGRQSNIVEYPGDQNGDDEQRWFEARLASLSGTSDANNSILLLARETTAEKRSEERLQQAQKMEAIGQLTGGIAHDFNNLLMIVIGNLELTENIVDHPEQLAQGKQRIQNAIAAAQRGAALTARLLAFGRRQSLAPQVVDVNTLVDGMKTLMQRTLGENIDLEFALDPDVWFCRVDPSQLENAVINLAINARDATPGGGRITFATGKEIVEQDSEAEAGEYVVVTVTDKGTGMSPETLDRVFEPFFTTKDTGKGSGLGLSMVYGFVKQSGGSVSISSKINEGTVVKLYLPRELETTKQIPDMESTRQTEAAGGETVLVVEDNAEILELAMGIMQILGFHPIPAENARQALDILDREPGIAAMFSDVVLPGKMSGLDLAVKALHQRPDLKILMASGYSDTDELPEEIRLRNIEVLSKPYRFDEIARGMAAILKS